MPTYDAVTQFTSDNKLQHSSAQEGDDLDRSISTNENVEGNDLDEPIFNGSDIVGNIMSIYYYIMIIFLNFSK